MRQKSIIRCFTVLAGVASLLVFSNCSQEEGYDSLLFAVPDNYLTEDEYSLKYGILDLVWSNVSADDKENVVSQIQAAI